MMSAVTDIVAAWDSVGLNPEVLDQLGAQGTIVRVSGYPKALRLYAWAVSDNGRATGTVRPADERRIQASRTQPIEVTSNPETLVLGWCDDETFSPTPLIVAFNPAAVAARVNAKLERRSAEAANVRGSDSQQFRQALLDNANADGLAVGRNQHGEYVIAMKPELLLDYLITHKPAYHRYTAASAPGIPDLPSMADLVAEAEIEEAAPTDEDPDQLPDFDPTAIEDGRERVAREIAIRRGQTEFRQKLLRAYGCCAMTGCTVEPALEAAHIVRYQGPGTNHVTNGLLLRADIHSLFDFGLLSVDPMDLSILVSPLLDGTEYSVLQGHPLSLGNRGAYPDQRALAIHRATSNL